MDAEDYLGTVHRGLPPWVLSPDYSQTPAAMPKDRQIRRATIEPIVAGMK